MDEEAFYNELWIYCYKTQIDGYPLGHPRRQNFKPIVPFKNNEDGSYNRPGTLDMASYHLFSAEDQAALLSFGEFLVKQGENVVRLTLEQAESLAKEIQRRLPR